jgi:diacylglycerol kinase family enzyme
MYAYFIDDWVYKKNKRTLDRLDLWLTQVGISGRKIRLARLNDVSESILDCSRSGIKIIVAVGDDSTASRIINTALQMQKRHDLSFVYGMVPITVSAVASMLGVSDAQNAVNILATKQSKLIDLGLLNKRHYFTTAAIFPSSCSLGFKAYSISSMHEEHHVSVCNYDVYSKHTLNTTNKFNIVDGVLEAVIAYLPHTSFMDRFGDKNSKNQYIPESIFPIKKITIQSKQKNITVIADAEKQLSTPVDVEIVPRAINMIFNSNAQIK